MWSWLCLGTLVFLCLIIGCVYLPICLHLFVCVIRHSAMTFRFQDKTEKKNANLSVIAIESIVGAPAQKYKEEQLGKVAGGNSPFSRPRPRGGPEALVDVAQ